MIKGLYLDPRSWEIDFKSSLYWNPEQYGVKVDLHPDGFNIPKKGIKDDYKFVIASEVWEILMHKTLDYLRQKGLKVFLIAREPFKTAILKDAMFTHNQFLYQGRHYFTPDVVLAAGEAYSALWSDKTRTMVTGYPRFDYWAAKQWDTNSNLRKKYGLEPDKKLIFFPSYPPVHYKKEGDKDIMLDLYPEQEETLKALETFALNNNEYQVIVKVHPAAWKCYIKGMGSKKEVAGLMKQYLDKPTSYMKVIGDERNSGLIAKELLVVSDLVVGFTSTMLLEAGMINKPTIHLLFGKTAELKGLPEYCEYLPTAYNKNELSNFILNKNTKIISQSLIEKYLYKIDGKSCERICEAIKNEFR